MTHQEEINYMKISNKVKIQMALKILSDVMNSKEYGIDNPRQFKDSYNSLYEIAYKD